MRGLAQMTVRNTDFSVLRSGLIGMMSGIAGFLARERSLFLLLIFSFLAACIYCLNIFDLGFLSGTSAYWGNPRGIVGRSWADISTALSGYLFFQQDAWQLPLFHVSKLGAPAGTDIIFTDSIPLVALAGRIVFLATATPVNLYGVWAAICFIGSAMALTALVAMLGQRNIAAAAMATVAGLCMPGLLARWGHMSLMAQFEIPLALIFYLHNYKCGRPWRLFWQGTGLMWLALWTHAYLFAMVGAIVLATVAQAVSNRTLRATAAAALLAGLLGTLGLVMAISGYFHSRGGLAAEGVGIFSMNLLSPFVPQYSGLFAPLRNTIVDATGGQYEGFSYLGIGVLVLLWITMPWQFRVLRTGLRDHLWLGALFIGFTVFALSNIIYLGPVMLLHVPLPEHVAQMASVFRSTGRFIWPVMYGSAALAIAAPVVLYGRYGAFLLCLAIPLQWFDTEPLRQRLAAITHGAEKPHIDLMAWRSAMSAHKSIRVLPQNFCLRRPFGWNSEITMELQLLAGIANRPINTVYASRFAADCRADQHVDGMPQSGARQLSIFLDEFSGFERMKRLAATSSVCRAGPGLVVCSDIPGDAAALTVLARTDRE